MKKIILLLMSIVFFASCAQDDESGDCLSYSEAYVETVESIDTADSAGALYQLHFYVSNGCGEFGSFEETVDGNTITVKLIAKYEGCVCTEAIVLKDAVYNFTPTAPGTYALKFKTSEDTFVTETITVE